MGSAPPEAPPPTVQPQQLGIGRLFDQVHDAIIVADGAGRVVLWNKAATALFGYTATEAAGLGLQAIIPERLRPQHEAGMARFRDSGKGPVLDTGQALILPALRKDGQEVTVELTLSSITDAQVPGRFVLAIVRDVTARTRLEREQRLLNLAAHELNTPLTPLLLQLELFNALPEEEVGPRAKAALVVLDRSVHRLASLVQDLLEVARLESDRLVLRRGPVPLGPLVDEVVAAFEANARSARIGLEARTAGAPVLDGDAGRLHQVLTNLLANALRFTPAGGTVEVEARTEGGEAVLRVRDSGVGLTTEQLGRLFQPFEQVHGHDPGGSGLGLFISRGIVEQHGGRIWAESEGPGRGATFVVALPLRDRGMKKE